jgi:hypothetical protein
VSPFLFLHEVYFFPSSSLEMGATLDKPSEMMAFSLHISELGMLHLLGIINQIFFQLFIVKPFSLISV